MSSKMIGWLVFVVFVQLYQSSVAWIPSSNCRRRSTCCPSSFWSPRSPIAVQSMEMDEFLGVSGDIDDEDEISDAELEATMPEWDDRIPRFNTVHLTGRIGNDAEPRYFDDGKVVLNLSLAVRRKYHWLERKHLDIKYGEEETDWYTLELWGQQAEFAAKYVDKGARVGVIGSLQIDQWNDKETGEPRNRAKVVVRDFDILETKAESELRRSNRRGPSFYRDDSDDYDNNGPSSAGTGGFFDEAP